ncbi:MAG: YtxH domain-containing protein [Flavobacteriales bacterium]|nr:YtxH domain-containing protein [Flavobacteriales bacterium]
MSSGKVLLGVLAGVAAGATLGILFAPDKGSRTRQKIADKSNQYADDLGDRFTDFMDDINRKFDALSSDAKHMAQNTRHKLEDAAKDMSASVNSSR